MRPDSDLRPGQQRQVKGNGLTPSRETSTHHSEAVRLINEKLADQEAQLSTLLIATVAALVIAEVNPRYQ